MIIIVTSIVCLTVIAFAQVNRRIIVQTFPFSSAIFDAISSTPLSIVGPEGSTTVGNSPSGGSTAPGGGSPSSGSSPSGGSSSGSTTPPSSIWKPGLVTSWQWQLTTPIDQSVNVAMYDIDLFENDASVVVSLHAAGRKVLCYMEVGAWENYRPDAGSFPASIKGNNMSGYPDEKYVDIRSPLLKPIIEARLDLCKSKGFDGVEPDIDDGYAESTGFPITYADQIAYNTWLAGAAHARGLSIALKNDIEQAVELSSVFDYAVNEQCFQYSECANLTAFINKGKPVFHVEYSLSTGSFCTQANNMNFNSMKKHTSLDSYRVPCR